MLSGINDEEPLKTLGFGSAVTKFSLKCMDGSMERSLEKRADDWQGGDRQRRRPQEQSNPEGVCACGTTEAGGMKTREQSMFTAALLTTAKTQNNLSVNG